MNSFTHSIRVYWEDTDGGGIVYYANYLKFAERARTEWLRALGHDQGELREKLGVVFVVRECRVRYRAPARLDDMLGVSVEAVKSMRHKIQLRQIVTRDADICAELDVELVAVNAATGALAEIPVALN